MKKRIKFIIPLGLALLVLALAYVFFKPRKIEVEASKVTKGEFIEEIVADGYFRAKDRYTVTAFADGDIKRVDLRVGDLLKKGERITELFWDVKYVPVRSPVAGVVTKIYRESAGPVHRGDAIVEVVDPRDLEIVAELLTTDATRVKVGDLAFATGWGDSKKIQSHVSKISKAGFIKISALGVEEERTEVIMEPEKLSAEDKKRLGHTFHTLLTIQVAKIDQALKIPSGALVRDGSEWAVYQVINGKAQLKHVALSLRGNEEAAISKGLNEGDVVINFPGDLIKDGTPVKIKK